jgi:mono/diheme cytochrome c family protein
MRTPTALTLLCALASALAACGVYDGGKTPASGGSGGVETTSARAPGPAPVMGGGLLALADGRFVAVADADRSVIWVVDLALGTLRGRVELPAGSWPNRMAEDGKGNLRVVLRRTGQLATVSVTSMALKGLEAVCAEPRGVAWSAHLSATLVACASGELVTLPLAGGSSTTRVIERDLRDVVVLGERVLVTTFREGKVLDVTGPTQLLARVPGLGTDFSGGVAWRAVAANGQLVIAHQRARNGEIVPTQPTPSQQDAGLVTPTPAGAYGNSGGSPGGFAGCTVQPVVRSAVSVFNVGGQLVSTTDVGGALPVDVSVDRPTATGAPAFKVAVAGTGGVEGPFTCPRPATGEPIVAVATTPDGTTLQLVRSPLTLIAGTARIALDTTLVDDPGHALFHTVAPTGVACASCHPEAGEDAHVWTVKGKAHRTQALTGGLLDTAPFHWEGKMKDLSAVMDETFVLRMGATLPGSPLVDALGAWLQQQPAPKAPPAPASLLTRGQALFQQSGCDGCHSGARYTNGQTMNVGTGDRFQVPSLTGVGARTPLMHDGCAATVRARFVGTCGGSSHGDTSTLNGGDLDALSAFVESL